MGAMPGNIETDHQPPMTVPLRHFVVGLGFLLGGVLVGIGIAADAVPGLGTLVHVHLLLAGWICITIMGAMTQFVPVWSGVTLYSRRLATVQLALVACGILGFSIALVFNMLGWLVPFGILMLAGFWTFVYNIVRTMIPMESYDVTERHFLIALGFFVLLTSLGLLLAIGFTRPVFGDLPIARGDVVMAHATLAVFGAVLTTVYGALYQLGTMFTQTELHGIDDYLRPVEELGHPVGVVLLALGRLVDIIAVARLGGVLVLAAALAFAIVLARRLYEMQVPRTPMHTRYAVVVPALTAWALATVPTWLRDPTAADSLFGAPTAVHLFVLGTVGFVVLGTLYHIVPFIVWVHRYSDLLGFEDVPMIDDLYDDRLAAADATLLVVGTLVLVLSDVFQLPPSAQVIGGGVVTIGVVVFTANMLRVIRIHSPHSLSQILLGSLDPRRKAVQAAESDPSK
ncbi:hypothetical protein [Halobaculum magnesiiphilum]|uniref:Cbb3-type cytochrome c oxidase subunit I n=1 Tax=Halobaculum magnesiiphilum TaxID=1017351 RepID=A0A8T8WJ29_9EURY|nr:hypothetical protein [Halobaculum magnesiiphilum]QZP39830.1 hypothetical protein K6T50_18690 [Halobaculum magnesiiphilum]